MRRAVDLSAGLKALCLRHRVDDPVQAIRAATADLAAAAGATAPPIALKPLLRKLSIELSFECERHDRSSIAALSFQDRRLSVVLNEKSIRRNWRRARFSIAHEIVHALLISILKDDALIASLDADKSSHAQLERICNIGAAELLMPSGVFRSALRANGVSSVGLSRLYDLFLVSRRAMLWQIAWLTPGGAVIVWDKVARSSMESSRMRVVDCYLPYGVAVGRPWLPRGATTRHLSNSIVEDASASMAPCMHDEISLSIGKLRWVRRAIAVRLNVRAGPQPVFEGMSIGDEDDALRGAPVVLFLAECGAGMPQAFP